MSCTAQQSTVNTLRTRRNEQRQLVDSLPQARSDPDYQQILAEVRRHWERYRHRFAT